MVCVCQNMEGDLNDDNKEISSDWNKVKRDCIKAGIRDGAAAGREKTFQASFDDGYIEGYRTGFAIGKYKGALKARQFIHSSSENLNETLLQDSKKGWCCMCKDELLLDKTIEEIKTTQTDLSNVLLQKLHSKYSVK